MPKTRLNITLDHDLQAFVKEYARENRTTVAELFTQFILAVKRRTEGKRQEYVLADSLFYMASGEMQARLEANGTDAETESRGRRRGDREKLA